MVTITALVFFFFANGAAAFVARHPPLGLVSSPRTAPRRSPLDDDDDTSQSTALKSHKNDATEEADTDEGDTTKDLYIVGCGVLGTAVAKSWLRRHPAAVVVGETRSERSHGALETIGVVPGTRQTREKLLEARGQNNRFRSVLVCTPPSAYESGASYASEVSAASALCDAHFVMTSSGGVFAEDEGGVCSESSPTADTTRANKLLEAERAALANGAVVRLAGLYALRRGAHEYWYGKGKIDADPTSLVNLVHYDDAAEAVANALDGRARPGDLYLVADMRPKTRAEIADAASRHPDFKHRPKPVFTGVVKNARGPRGAGRIYDCTYTMEKLDWRPRYADIQAFFEHEVSSLLPDDDEDASHHSEKEHSTT